MDETKCFKAATVGARTSQRALSLIERTTIPPDRQELFFLRLAQLPRTKTSHLEASFAANYWLYISNASCTFTPVGVPTTLLTHPPSLTAPFRHHVS